MRMGRSVVTALVFATAAVLAPAPAAAQDDISLSIDRRARLTAEGAVVVTVRITCDPLPGTEEFQEAHAGAVQARTGAEGEGGIDGTVVCDGTTRAHTARLFPITDAAFRRGPADASASLVICNVVDDDQVCAEASTARRIVISGPLLA
jgi:hypothetical protein